MRTNILYLQKRNRSKRLDRKLDMKPHVREWIDSLKHVALARRLGRCMRCSERPALGRVSTEERDFAIWFCKGCQKPAYGTVQASESSRVAIKTLMSLPIVIEVGPIQGTLL
jgi:hypothetical protein